MVYDKVNFEFEHVFITPEIAKEMLENTSNPQNRDIKTAGVTNYVEDMESGKWDTASDGVFLFYYDGVLRNGHHRLMAISKSNVSMWMVIVRPAKDPTIFDNGKLRTAKDHMVMMGYEREKCNAKTLSVGTFFLNSIVPGRRRTKLEVIDYVVKHPQINTARIICDSARKGEECITRNNYISAAVYCALRCNVDEKTIREFIRVTNSGFITSERQTAAMYFKKSVKALASEKLNTKGGESYSKKVFRIVQEAIKDFASETTVKHLYKGEYNGYADMVLEEDFNKEQTKGVQTTAKTEKEATKNVKKDFIKKDAKTGKVFITLPLNDKSEYAVTMKKVNEYKELYPAVNIEQELRNMRGWSNGNPTKRKTRSGIERFINSWLSRTQNGYHK